MPTYLLFMQNANLMSLSEETRRAYKKVLLPDNNPAKIRNLSGVNDPFEVPANADLIVDNGVNPTADSVEKLCAFIDRSFNKRF